MGCFSGGVKGQSVSQIDKLTPAQAELVQALAAQAGPAVSRVQGATIPGMEFAPTGPSELQQQAFDIAGQLPSLYEDIGQGTLGPIGKYARRGFQEETIPAIMGALGYGGAARSSGAADILGREGRNLELGLASQFAPMYLQLPSILGQAGREQRAFPEAKREFELQRFMGGAPEADPRLGFIGPAFTSAYDTAVQQGFYQPGIGTQLAGPLIKAGGLMGAAMLSDKRAKEDIKTIDDALEKVNKIDGKVFKYKAKAKERDGGVIAQDLEKVLPEAVIERAGIKYVKYEAVVGLLVNAVKELARKVG